MTHPLLINPTAFEAGLLAAAEARGLQGARLAALKAFSQTGLPHRRLEAWKWTDLRAALRDDLTSTEAANDVIAPSIFGGLGAYEITVMNGVAEWSGPAPEGVKVSRTAPDAPLSEEAKDHPLANLVCAFAEEAIDIVIDEGAQVEHPILVRRIASAGAFHQRISVRLGAGANAVVIESFDGAGVYFSNSLSDYGLGTGAKLVRLVLQDGSDAGVEASLATLRLERGAEFHQTALVFGAKAARLETRVSCVGDGSRINLLSAELLDGARHGDITSHVAHNAERCTTRQMHKSALKERARGVFQGKFLVARGGQQTDAKMRASALLLSEAAEADHKPELEIYADNVECAHGSTVGALDENALFYIKSRGLDEREARALLVEAFLSEVLDDMPHPAVQHVFRQRIAHWLEFVR
jgi:Fe-S cluster assembly protein SufD